MAGENAAAASAAQEGRSETKYAMKTRKVDGREVMTVLAGEILSCRDRSWTLPMAVSLPPPCRPVVTPGPSDRC